MGILHGFTFMRNLYQQILLFLPLMYILNLVALYHFRHSYCTPYLNFSAYFHPDIPAHAHSHVQSLLTTPVAVNRCAARLFKTCDTWWFSQELISLPLDDHIKKKAIANTTVPIWYEWIRIIPILFVRSAKNTFFGVPQNFINYFICAMRQKTLKITVPHNSYEAFESWNISYSSCSKPISGFLSHSQQNPEFLPWSRMIWLPRGIASWLIPNPTAHSSVPDLLFSSPPGLGTVPALSPAGSVSRHRNGPPHLIQILPCVTTATSRPLSAALCVLISPVTT